MSATIAAKSCSGMRNSPRQAASALGLQEASVRRSLMEHRLSSFMVGGTHRIPTWQFQRGTMSGLDDERGVTRLVDGLARVIAAIPADATP